MKRALSIVLLFCLAFAAGPALAAEPVTPRTLLAAAVIVWAVILITLGETRRRST